MRAADAGHRVVGFGTGDIRVKRLRAAQSRTPDIPDSQIACVPTNGTYTPTARADDPAGFDVAVIAVPTPLRDGAPDRSPIEHATRILASHPCPGCAVVLESTTYRGTTEDLLQPLLASVSSLIAGADL
ncbi:hypothetical protein [Streptomyces sp. NPDC059262]|uniref:hypothetical protein n=1 Tax=Streptomyces sp. NPDC059262 TaxID=3346797 RepID=UPI0036898BF7